MRFVSDRRALKSTPEIMSCDEIRYWLVFLRKQGWSSRALAHALGIYNGATLLSKIRGDSFLYVTEQRRLSKLIPRILSGELVSCRINGKRAIVVADDPKPLRLPPQMAIDFRTGRLSWRIPRVASKPAIPGWNRGIANMCERYR